MNNPAVFSGGGMQMVGFGNTNNGSVGYVNPMQGSAMQPGYVQQKAMYAQHGGNGGNVAMPAGVYVHPQLQQGGSASPIAM